MADRRSTNKDTDDRIFPVRIFVLVPTNGFGRLMGTAPDTIESWLNREVGRGGYAQHGGGRCVIASGIRDRVAFYFRHPEAAVRFLLAFPDLELADGT